MNSTRLEAMRTGVVGAGLMGAEIALVQALAGCRVTLIDKDAAALDRAMARLGAILDKGVQRGFYPGVDPALVLASIVPSTDVADLADCEVVTEAVVEVLDVKRAVFREIAQVTPASTLLVSNTSTIPISVLAGGLDESRRGNFIGMHYFSPVSRMALVEVIPGLATGEEAVARACALAQAAGKTPIRVKDVPGFAVNRVLHAFMIEAVRLVEEGVVSVEDLDTACRLGLGHPIGPFELMDATTSSLCLQAQEIMFDAYGERFRPRPLLKQRVAAGLVGGKGRPGWRRQVRGT